MFIITIKGLSGEVFNHDDKSIAKEDQKRRIDGIDCQDCFTDYMDSGDCSAVDSLSGGFMRFSYENDNLYVIVEYRCIKQLTETEGKELIEYTQGQMSDGIGEGFEQRECNDEGDFVSPWYYGQKLEISDNLIVIRDENIDELLSKTLIALQDLKDQQEKNEVEVDNMVDLADEYSIDPLTYMDLGMDLKDIYKGNYNYATAVLRAIKFFRKRGFEITYKGYVDTDNE